MTVQSISCPACGAPVTFAENSQQTQCSYCQTWLTDGNKRQQAPVAGVQHRHLSAAAGPSGVEPDRALPRSWLHLFFVPSGRITRRYYWLGLAVVAGLLWLRTFWAPPALEPAETEPNGLASGFMLIALWIFLMVHVKRWRDRGKSGWWTAIWLLPFGFVWVLYELGFQPSKLQSNQPQSPGGE